MGRSAAYISTAFQKIGFRHQLGSSAAPIPFG